LTYSLTHTIYTLYLHDALPICYSGTLSGLGSLTKTGTGTLTLAGDNSGFSGTLVLSGGTVKLANASAAAGSAVNFNGGSLSFGTFTGATVCVIARFSPPIPLST